MKPVARIGLSELREIGFRLWDPIGLCRNGADWQNQSFSDEYDFYLQEAVSRIGRGETAEDVARFLADIEEKHMGLGINGDCVSRTLLTARALADRRGSKTTA